LLPSSSSASELSEVLSQLESIRKVIRNDPIDLFGHRSIERAKSCFDVSNKRPALIRLAGQLDGGKRTGHCRVDIAYHNNDVWPLARNDFLKLPKNLRCLGCLGARTDARILIWLWETQVPKKAVRHRFIVVLPSVHQKMFNLGANPGGIVLLDSSNNRLPS